LYGEEEATGFDATEALGAEYGAGDGLEAFAA